MGLVLALSVIPNNLAKVSIDPIVLVREFVKGRDNLCRPFMARAVVEP
jgi:hypothetical protein